MVTESRGERQGDAARGCRREQGEMTMATTAWRRVETMTTGTSIFGSSHRDATLFGNGKRAPRPPK
ncbi:hypothetical protein BU14_1124s0003 [Porphyra umbilicalis]|uniref:Uncharacterized protein n=1 Tax=Porphyra umbilicalis TaxID=2786 RepID=A0A1X6NME8_PORUM|nr:hypothetical protein BU14_1124s0003 [Porphyra umbilicalis]|eukprot:OSX69811.1 hypothetical protein BU14_1124s0003 [Porphyra umbilicalis]